MPRYRDPQLLVGENDKINPENTTLTLCCLNVGAASTTWADYWPNTVWLGCKLVTKMLVNIRCECWLVAVFSLSRQSGDGSTNYGTRDRQIPRLLWWVAWVWNAQEIIFIYLLALINLRLVLGIANSSLGFGKIKQENRALLPRCHCEGADAGATVFQSRITRNVIIIKW